jgi:hypothetical protein
VAGGAELGSRVKVRLALVLAGGVLVLVAAPRALADPILVAPDDGHSFTARSGQITFQASTAAVPVPNRMDFYVSRDSQVGPGGVFLTPIDIFPAGSGGVTPPVYEAGPGSDPNWPNKPGTYYWQAAYHDCSQAPPKCASPIRSLTVSPLPAPTQVSPPDGATIPFARHRTFSIQDARSYSRSGTRLYIEFSKSTKLNPDGTFAHTYVLARPNPAGAGVYRFEFGQPYTRSPGTYYWIAERADCQAEADCVVTNDEIRSFTVAPKPPPPAIKPPNTFFTHRPGRRTHKRRVRFAFASNVAGASFECFYTEGWSRCRSPQIFRHLKPGRYRFKVRAVAHHQRDRSPASWLFKVRRRSHHT